MPEPLTVVPRVQIVRPVKGGLSSISESATKRRHDAALWACRAVVENWVAP